MNGEVSIGLLGPIAVRSGTDSVVVAGTRRQALVAILALAVPRPVSDDRLLDALWGDEPAANPANALQAQVSQLRRLVGNDVVVRDGNGYRLAIAPEAVDVHRMARLVADGRDAAERGDPNARTLYAEAVGLLRGPPLLDLSDQPFARGEIAGLEALALDAEEGLVDAELAAGHHADVVGRLTELVRDHPLRERFHAQLVLSLYRSGRQSDALRAGQAAREVLLEELGVDPGPELAELERAVLNHDAALLGPEPAVRRSTSALPAPLSSFVGREAELADLQALVAIARLVTVVGAGGMGKTRLAVEVAHRLGVDTEVCFVALAPVTDPVAVPDAVATAVGAEDRSAPESPGSARSPLVRAVDHIGGRPLVLVLDNAEHVAEAAAEAVSTLLAGCAGLRILATSRESLRVEGEQLLVLGPMRDLDAVRLFADRAQAVQARFDPAANEAEVADVCQRLDRMPLAIELAAARTKALPVGEIAERLDDRFRLLRSGGRDDGRTTGLRAAIDWSYDSLFDDERDAFCRLAVFAGGATVAAAEAFCGPEALGLLDRLVDKSLVVADTTGPRARFRLLESLRVYGLDRLDDQGRRHEVHVEHLAWCAAKVEAAAAGVRGEGQLPWLAELDAEHDNLRAALAFGATDDPVGGLRLLGSLILPWYLRGRSHDARQWIEILLAVDDGSAPRARAKVLAWSALVADVGTWTEQPGRIEAALRQDESRTTVALVADSGNWTTQPAGVEAALLQAEARAREAIVLLGDVDDLDLAEAHRMLALALVRQTTVGLAVDEEELAALIPATIERFEALTDPYGLAIITILSSISALARGDVEQAARDRSRAEKAALRGGGERFCLSRVELLSALLAEGAGELAEAYGHVERGLVLLSELGLEPHITAQAAVAARLAEQMGDFPAAERWRAFVADRDSGAADGVDLAAWALARNADGLRLRAAGDVEGARVGHLQARDQYAGSEMASGLAFSESCLGFLESASGRTTVALGHHRAALDAAVAVEEPGALALALDGLASLDVDDPDRAAVLIGGATRLWTDAVGRLCTLHEQDLATAVRSNRSALGDAAQASALARGSALDLVDLLNLAEGVGLPA